MNIEHNNIAALIVDDERLARENLKASIKDNSSWSVCAECDRGDQVLNAIEEFKPSIVFLDIKMPGIDGINVCESIRQLNNPPLVVFVTAFNAHAIEAFELCALDYLLKPYDDARFVKTVEKVEQQLQFALSQNYQLNQLSLVTGEKAAALDTLIVRSVGRIQLIKLSDVDWLGTAGNYVELHIKDKAILHRVSLSFLEKHIQDPDFIRVHRQSMIRLSRINEFLTIAEGQYAVVLKSGEQVSVSQKYKQPLLKELGIE